MARELYIKANVVPSNTTEYESVEPSIQIGYSEYDPEKKVVHISISLEMGKEDPEGSVPFHLKVQLLGEFVVDEEKFPIGELKKWSMGNSFYIFHPYLREHVFALTARCGFLPALLPLVTVPTLTIQSTPQA
jgi:preprotein translocase subunit SecB